jgi:hypothetical protein
LLPQFQNTTFLLLPHRAVSDIDGVTGMAILRAIAGGERDVLKLAQLRDPRCSKTEQEIAEQLSGHWREDHLFSLQQALQMYDAVEERIAAYEQEILRKLGEMERAEQRGQTAPPLAWGLQQLLRTWLHIEIHLLPMLAGAAISYAIGESIERLACISFGCCYGIPLREASPTVARLFRRYSLVLYGHTKKVAYASGLASEPLIPVQVLTSLMFALAGLAGLALFLAGMWRPAALVPIVCAWGWRAVSESLRADFRGDGRISSYQVMSLLALACLVLVTSLIPSEGAAPSLGLAFSHMLSLSVAAGLQAFWIALFLYYGRSRVTASTVSFHVLADQI